MNTTELKKKKEYVCSRYFLKSSFHPSCILRKNAIPKMFLRQGTDMTDENCNVQSSSLTKKRDVQDSGSMEIKEQ